MKVLMIFDIYDHVRNYTGAYHRIESTFNSAFENDLNYTYKAIYIGNEPGFINTPKQLNDALLNEDYDIAVVSEGGDMVVDLQVAKKIGKKLFIMHWEGWSGVSNNPLTNFLAIYKKPRIWGAINQPASIYEFSQYCNVLCYDFGYGEIYPNIYAVWNPYNSKLYKLDESIERDIDASHNGAVVTPERIRYVELFKRANFPITYTGSQQKHIFPYQALLEEDYVKIYQRSKISLCFNDSIFGQTAVARKQKIIEAGLCGGFPLVTNPETYTTFKGSWFKEGIHFISMNENNCIDKIKYYLNHPDKRKEISENLHKEINSYHTDKHWWNRLFEWAKDK